MKEIFYLADSNWLERYLKERASTTLADMGEIQALWRDNPIASPGSDEAVNKIYSLDGNTAHIKIEGALSPEGPDAWDLFWGYKGASFKTITAAMERAKKDFAVEKVIFDIDSPGGTLAGTDETWQAHKALAKVKPTEVHTGNLASAAYYIATPAKKIFARSPTSQVGSIGVLVATYDWSKWEENVGIKEVVITSSNAPDKYPDISTKQGKETIRVRLNAMERVFYSRITESRGKSTEHIAEHFGRGGMLIAKDPSMEHEDATRAGLIDGLYSDIEIIENPDNITIKSASAEINNSATAENKQEANMDLSELLKANPAAAAEIDRLKAEAKEAGKQEAKAEYAAMVGKAIPYIESTSYPNSVKKIACSVLRGESSADTLIGAVAAYDGMKEAQSSTTAISETSELGAAIAEQPELKMSDADKAWEASIAEAKARRDKADKEVI